MSCCDNSTINIVNNSGTNLTITSSSTSAGTLRNASAGTQIGTGTTYPCAAYSSGGSGGACAGSITISVGSSKSSFVLTYDFTPKNAFGNCPCTASAPGTNPLTGGNYQASAVSTNGSNDGQASVAWTVIATLAP